LEPPGRADWRLDIKDDIGFKSALGLADLQVVVSHGFDFLRLLPNGGTAGADFESATVKIEGVRVEGDALVLAVKKQLGEKIHQQGFPVAEGDFKFTDHLRAGGEARLREGVHPAGGDLQQRGQIRSPDVQFPIGSVFNFAVAG